MIANPPMTGTQACMTDILIALLRNWRLCQHPPSSHLSADTHQSGGAHEGAVNDLAPTLSMHQREQSSKKPGLYGRLAQHTVPPQLQTQVLHARLVLVLHIDAVHVLHMPRNHPLSEEAGWH